MARRKVAQTELPMQSPELAVHPLAAVFPMMAEDELAELAEDIRANGQINPIMLDAAGAVVDGRNRLAACQIAGVEPQFATLKGQDPRAYIVSANLERRNLTKGQQAMALAMLYPIPEKGGRGKLSDFPDSLSGISKGHAKDLLSQARIVLRHAPDLAPLVMSGGMSLDEAYRKAQAREAATASEEAKLAQLRQQAPDIFVLVTEERISLAAGMAEFAERLRNQRQMIEAGQRSSAELCSSFANHVLNIVGAWQFGQPGLLTEAKMAEVKKAMEMLERVWREINS
jgi:hypothetical protein